MFQPTIAGEHLSYLSASFFADLTFDTELALAEYTRAVAYARADGKLEADLIKAEGRIDVAEAQGEADYHNELAAAKSARDNARAAADVAWTTTVAEAAFDAQVGGVLPASLPDPDRVICYRGGSQTWGELRGIQADAGEYRKAFGAVADVGEPDSAGTVDNGRPGWPSGMAWRAHRLPCGRITTA